MVIEYIKCLSKENIYPDGIKVKEQTDGKVLKIYPDGKIEILKNSI